LAVPRCVAKGMKLTGGAGLAARGRGELGRCAPGRPSASERVALGRTREGEKDDAAGPLGWCRGEEWAAGLAVGVWAGFQAGMGCFGFSFLFPF